MGRVHSIMKSKFGTAFVAVLFFFILVSPALAYLTFYLNGKHHLPPVIDPFNVFTEDQMNKVGRELMFFLIYYVPTAAISFLIAAFLLLASYLMNSCLMRVAIALDTLLVIESGFVLIVMVVLQFKWFLVLPLLLPSLSQFYILWFLVEYKEHLKKMKLKPYDY